MVIPIDGQWVFLDLIFLVKENITIVCTERICFRTSSCVFHRVDVLVHAGHLAIPIDSDGSSMI